MNDALANTTQRWCTTRKFRQVVLAIAMLALIYKGVDGIFLRVNDFHWHVIHGRTMLEGRPMQTDDRIIGDHYPLGRAVINMAIALPPYRVARAMCLVLGVASLVWSLVLWRRMAGPALAGSGPIALAAAAFTLVILYPYVFRDLDDCGLRLLLLGFMTFAGRCIQVGKPVRGGLWLGLAATYKLTPIIFLPLLLWKRQWRTVAAMLGVIITLNLVVPTMLAGWDKTIEAHGRFLAVAKRGMKIQDPSQNPVEPPRHQNQSLQFAIARYLQTHPPGHPLHSEHPLFVQFGSLSPRAAGLAAKAVLLVLAMALLWRMRKPWSAIGADSNFAAQWAAVCILTALLSPLCWLQHLVQVIPAMFLIFLAVLSRPGAAKRWRIVLLVAIGVITLLLQRDVVQRELSIIVLSYKFDTLVALAAMLLVLTLPCASQPLEKELEF